MESNSALIFSIADTIHLYRKRRNRRGGRSDRSYETSDNLKAQRRELHRLLHESTGLSLVDPEKDGSVTRPTRDAAQ
jgi:hypothetical protein